MMNKLLALILAANLSRVVHHSSQESLRIVHEALAKYRASKLVTEGIQQYCDGNADESRSLFQKALELDPTNARAYYELGCVLEHEFQDFDGARSCYESSIRYDPTFFEAHNNLGTLLNNHYKDLDNAHLAYEHLIKYDPTSENYELLASILSQKSSEDFERARECLERALELDQRCNQTHFQLAVLLEKHFEEFGLARKHMKKAIEYRSEHDPDLSDRLESIQRKIAFHDCSEHFASNHMHLSLLHANHPHHEFYQKLRGIINPGFYSNDERSQTIRPLLSKEVRNNFRNLLRDVDFERNFFKCVLEEWISFYTIAFTNPTSNFIQFANSIKVKPRHLICILEIINEFRNYLRELFENPKEIELHPRVREKIAMLSMKLYTMERENGGPYRELNEMLQDDNQGLVFSTQKRYLQPHVIIPFAFKYLFEHHEKKYGATKAVTLPGSFWRGMNRVTQEQWEKLQNQDGCEFYWPCFVSTTYDRKVAENFCKLNQEEDREVGPESVLFHICLRTNAFALSLRSISALAEEKEVLLFPYHRFRVGIADSIPERTSFKGRGIVYVDCLGCEFHS